MCNLQVRNVTESNYADSEVYKTDGKKKQTNFCVVFDLCHLQKKTFIYFLPKKKDDTMSDDEINFQTFFTVIAM